MTVFTVSTPCISMVELDGIHRRSQIPLKNRRNLTELVRGLERLGLSASIQNCALLTHANLCGPPPVLHKPEFLHRRYGVMLLVGSSM